MYYTEFEEKFDHVAIQLIEEETTAMTSPVDFNRMVGNLIKNAFTHGSKRFSVYNELSDHAMMIYIENKVDHQENIQVDRLFERTYRGDENRTSGSTGLGLSIAQKIAEGLDYRLEASLNNSVLQFKLTIPIDDHK